MNNEIPRWMPTYVWGLCFGEELAADRPGHFILAARFSRLATGPLTREPGRWDKDLMWFHQHSELPIAAGDFVGSLEIATKHPPAGSPRYIGVWLKALRVPPLSGYTPGRSSGRPGEVEPLVYQLPITDPEKFHRAIWELTRPLRGKPPLEESWKGHS